ncbi:protein mono-ADP-ribosyltransferase PARP11-like [Palaemon carinicauda]|uniref:protein mono-ADP-ribosyltransferase PARP11-like n=1 Tax=Palaemon carinicauda TaxID=392227 RepID=UPI0035B5FC9F
MESAKRRPRNQRSLSSSQSRQSLPHNEAFHRIPQFGRGASNPKPQNERRSQSAKDLRGPRSAYKNLTKWSYYHDGDVEVPEICVYSIDNRCSFEDRGCLRLHAKCTSQWQVFHKSVWCNFRNFHSIEIEEAFEDVTQTGVQLTPVNPSKLGNAGKDMFKILGNDLWEVEFEQMWVKNLNSPNITYKIRRLSTQSAALSNSSKATTFVWYFLDVNNKWIKYGENDSTKNTENTSSITSEEIEKCYNSNRLDQIKFSTSKFQYILDMESMQQTNTVTNNVRPVRRRPLKKFTIKQENPKHQVGLRTPGNPVNQDLPPLWDSMKTTDPMRIITLENASKEYNEISHLLLLTLPGKRAQAIKRIQNPFLWRAFKNKQHELTLKYQSGNSLNIQRLFHGTREEYVESICKENFDWRLHGTNVGQMYGRGSYFSNSAAVASRYCQPSMNGHCFLLVAEVIVGEVTKGDSSMTRPPKNRSTNELYDTTVDDLSAPKIFVKYDKQEYCPLYIIQFA